MINWLSENYLQGVNSIILGTNNKIRGRRIYMKGDNLEIIGENNIVFNSNYKDSRIVGRNIVRVGSYDINLKAIELIMTDVTKAIKTLT